MRHVHLPQTDLHVSAVCYGTVPFWTAVSGSRLERLVEQYLAAGGNFFDSAHCYSFWVEGGEGTSERALGEVIRRLNCRQRVIVATKGGHPAVLPKYPRPDAFLSAETIASDVADSLQRLGIEQIDLYYLHRDDPRMKVDQIIDGLNEQIERGHIRYLAASNWSAERIAQANAYALSRGKRGFVVSQPEYNLALKNITPKSDRALRFLSDEDWQWHRRTQLPVACYSSTACGYFATGGSKAAGSYDNPVSRGRLARVEQLARELGRSPNQIALAWLMNQPFAVVPIIGTTDQTHLADAMAAAEISLAADQVHWLRDGQT